MPLVVADRVRETTTTTGTGAVTLAGAVTGYQSFSAVGNGNTTYYTINAGSQWEVGIGTYSGAGPSLSRDTVLESSNSGSLVDFAAGTKDVFLTYPAEKSISDGYGLLPPANGGTGLSSSGTAGNVLTSNGTAWVSQLPAAGGITYTAVKTSNYTASANDGVQTDTSGGAFTVTLPATPAVGAQVIVVDSAGSWGTTNLTIGRNGSTIEGSATDLICNISSVSVQLVYSGTTWDVYAQLGGAAGGLVTVTGGGTGATTLTANGILLGNGISAVSTTAVGATGQVLVGNTGAAPTWSTLSGIGVTSFSGGMTGLTPASATTGAITLAGTLGVANGGTGATTLTSGYLVKGNGTSAVSASVVYDDGTNVGIGTASPGTKLDVLGAGNPTITLRGSDGAYTSILNLQAAGGGASVINATGGSNALVLQTNSSERMRIDSSGNVGIGTSAPIAGGFLTVGSGAGSSTAVQYLNAGSGGSALLGRISGSNTWFLGDTTAALGSGSGMINFVYGANPWIVYLNNAERMRVSSAGDVGIGTSSPDIFSRFYTRTVGINSSGTTMLQINGTTYGGIDLGFNGTRTANMLAETSGFYLQTVTASPMVFVTNGSERMRITSGGQLLVGTTTAVNTGGVFSTTGAAFSTTATKNSNMHGMSLIATDNANTMTGVWFGTGNGAHWSGIAGVRTDAATDWATHLSFYTHPPALTNINDTNERMRIDGSGNVGIGLTPSVKFQVAGTARVNQPGATRYRSDWYLESGNAYMNGFDDTGGVYIPLSLNFSSYTFNSGGSERARIDASGNLLVGTTSALDNGRISVAFPVATANGITVQTSGTSYFNNLMSFRNSSGTQVGYIYTNGSTTTFTSVSDTRLKENITDADSAGSIIDSIQVRKYDWKADGSHQRYGFVAQELAAVAPEAVHQPEDPDAMMGVDYSKLVPMLVKEIQSLRARMAQMEGK